MVINVPSETGRLNGVIVHTPGREISLVNPGIKDDLLFDDIIFEGYARKEHRDMLEVFKTAMPDHGEIFEIVDLARECFQSEDVKGQFIELMISELPYENIHTIQKELMELDADHFTQFIVEGSVGARNFNIHPSPNLLYTRDLAAIVGDSIILSRAAKEARVREFLMMQTIVDHHPLFKDVKKKRITAGTRHSIEGGDVLVASEKIVLIGMSERTSFSALMSVAEQLLDIGVEHVLAVDIPKQRSSMHLDTIFTFTDSNECVVFPPAIEEQTENVVDLFADSGSVRARQCPSLKEVLEELTGKDFTFIQCGGQDPIDQHREQWTDGANMFALAPGIVVGYGRNTKTFATMEQYGYRHMTQYEFIYNFKDHTPDPKKDGKIAVSFEGHELCRGRGGARCMTLPFSRQN